MFESFRRDPKTTKAVIPSYTAAVQACERWMQENHLYAPVDKDGTTWQIRLNISLVPGEKLFPTETSSPKHSKNFIEPSMPSNLNLNHCDWQVRLWAETLLNTRHLLEIGVLDQNKDSRFIQLASNLETQIHLKERVFIAASENDAKKTYMIELPQYVSAITKTQAKEIKKKLFCRLLERKRIFGSSSDDPTVLGLLEVL
jgi:hypothetical protein